MVGVVQMLDSTSWPTFFLLWACRSSLSRGILRASGVTDGAIHYEQFKSRLCRRNVALKSSCPGSMLVAGQKISSWLIR